MYRFRTVELELVEEGVKEAREAAGEEKEVERE